MSADIQAWFEDYERKLRSEGYKEGYKEGQREFLLRQMRARFGELPAYIAARVKAADTSDIERWGERVLRAQTIDVVFDELS